MGDGDVGATVGAGGCGVMGWDGMGCDGMGWDGMGGEDHKVKLFFSRGRYDAIERWRDLLGVFWVWELIESVCSGVSKLSGSGLMRCRTDMIRENVCGAC